MGTRAMADMSAGPAISSPIESVPGLAALLPRAIPASLTPALGFAGGAARISVAIDHALLPCGWTGATKPKGNPYPSPSPVAGRGAPARFWAAYKLPEALAPECTEVVLAEPSAGSGRTDVRVLLRHSGEHWVRPLLFLCKIFDHVKLKRDMQDLPVMSP